MLCRFELPAQVSARKYVFCWMICLRPALQGAVSDGKLETYLWQGTQDRVEFRCPGPPAGCITGSAIAARGCSTSLVAGSES